MAEDIHGDMQSELLGHIARLQLEIDEDSDDEGSVSDDDELREQEEAIDSAITLNEKLDKQLLKVHEHLKRRQAEYYECLKSIQEEIKKRATTKSSLQLPPVFKYNMCGFPFFRDEKLVPHDNDETISRRQLGMINYFHMYTGATWTSRNYKELENEIHSISISLKQEHLEDKLTQLKTMAIDKENRKMCEKRIRKQIAAVSNAPLDQVALPIGTDYDWVLISNNLKGRHTPSEVRGVWTQCLHPSLRKTPFNQFEYGMLEKIARKHKYENWDEIARELGGRRSAYQCFVFYRSVIAVKSKGTKWTAEEDEFLRRNVECYRFGEYIPWSTIATCFKDKTRIQIYNRYMNSVRPQLKKGRFLPEEDAVLFAAVDQFGPDFRKIVKYLPGRTPTQLRVRYKLSLCRSISVVWSLEDDRKLLELMKTSSPDSNPNYAIAAEHFPNKDRVTVRMRYMTLQKWLRRNPNADLRGAPRRGPRLLSRSKKVDLRTAVDNLVRRIEDDATKESRPRVTREVTLDNAIIKVFIKALNDKECAEQRIAEGHGDERIDKASEGKRKALKKGLGKALEAQKQIHEEVNIDCLRAILLLLKANLDEKQLMQSPSAEKYRGLTIKDESAEAPVQRVRTYSRNTTVFHPLPSPSIISVWNDSNCFEPKYILPPNYQTISACKTLLLEAHRTNQNRRAIVLAKHPELKEHYTKFLERSEILYTWCLYLSSVKADAALKSIYDDSYDANSDTKKKDLHSPAHLTIASGMAYMSSRYSRKADTPRDDGYIDVPDIPASETSLIVKEMSGQIMSIDNQEDQYSTSGSSEPSHSLTTKRKSKKGVAAKSRKRDSSSHEQLESNSKGVAAKSRRKRDSSSHELLERNSKKGKWKN